MLSTRDELLAFVQRSQLVAGSWSAAPDLIVSLGETWALLDAIPASESTPERLVLVLVLERLARAVLDRPWRPSLNALGASPGSVARVHVANALSFIVSAYDCPSLTLSDVADHVRISNSHLSHLLPAITGHGFASHLNGCRVLKSVVLLRTYRASVKEAAFTVGYASGGELCRQFQRRLQFPPSVLRQFPTIRPDWDSIA
jgi:AraC-like DNA-binding protein